MIEPMNMATSRDYRAIVFAGPSRSGKTMLLNSVWSHSITCDPARIGFYVDEGATLTSYESNTFSPIVRNSPDLVAKRGTGRGSDTLTSKIFVGGTHITLDPVSGSRLQERSLRIALGTEFDQYGPDIDGEGEPLNLILARTHMAGSRGIAIIESSPRAPIMDESEISADPHVAPKVEYGVFSHFPNTTRARLYWPCPCCGEFFVPNYDMLRFPKGLSPKESGQAAQMKCPHCPELISPDYKLEMLAQSKWLHMGVEGKPVSLDSGDVVETDMLGYWLDGTQAAFMNWSDIVTKMEEAEQAFATTRDESKLRSVVNTRLGAAYRRRSTAGGDISLTELQKKAEQTPSTKGLAPSWTAFILISVDTQGTYFSVGVTAFGLDGRRQPIDRFDLTAPDGEGNPESKRVLRPGLYAGDWSILNALENRRWPIEGTSWELGAVAATVDMQGERATTDNAYQFLRNRRAAGQGAFWHLSRGRGVQRKKEFPDRVWMATPETASNRSGKRRVAKDIVIMNMAADRLKDAVSAGLLMEEVAPNFTFVPDWMTVEQLLELTAERRDDDGHWSKRPGFVRNESLDHLVQAAATFIAIGGEKLSPDAPPDWARIEISNPFARFIGEPKEAPEEPEQAPSVASWIPEREDWL
jgi:phage terminase large subunit GpA-like protein